MADDDNSCLCCCCLVAIIIFALVFFSGESSDSSTKTVTDNHPLMEVTTSDTFYYYGPDTPAGRSGYTYAIVVDGKPYYMSDDNAEILAKKYSSMRAVMNYDLQKYDVDFRPDAYIVGRNGINAVYTSSHEKDTTMFEFENNNNFSFSYTTGNTVGYNTNANVVYKIYS